MGDVLVKNNPTRACERLVKVCPLRHEEVAWFAPRKVHGLLDKGRIGSRELYGYAAKNLKAKNLTYKKFMRVFPDIFTANRPVQMLARKLRRHYSLLLLSNTNAIHFNHIRKKFPILRIFRHFVLSYKVGHVKPERQIYTAAVRKSGYKAGECVFIDNEQRNVAGARKAGLKAIRYTSDSKLKADLKKLGVKF